MKEKEFRSACVEALMSSEETQQSLADVAGVNQSTVARWFAYTGDLSCPAYLLAVFPPQVSIPILTYLAAKHGYDLVQRPTFPPGTLNGKIEDESLDLAHQLGRLIDGAKKADKKQMLRILEDMNLTISRAKSEIYMMQ